MNTTISPSSLLPIILFAWHGRHYPEVVPDGPSWSQRTIQWLKMLKAYTDLGDGIEDDWVTPPTTSTFTLEPLTTPATLIKEGVIMENCVVEYAEGIARNICRVYSVRKNGERIATLDLRRSATDERPLPNEALGPGNYHLPLEISYPVHTLVSVTGNVITSPELDRVEGAEQRFKNLLQRYLAAHQFDVQHRLEQLTIEDLKKSLGVLAALAGIHCRWQQW